ncbi:unnamed protein product [Prorocentrum cordatum]|uniref:ATP-dependent DNA helicase n=1 Tax=Prorocentrum cordatum TaxID=2364126 RepID=A0ABN9Q1D7_9DINO|nr:unnamed protein product [Polarella glacialis]
MPPKFRQIDVLAALRRGEAEEAIRADLQGRGCPPPRISQLFKGARDIMKADVDAEYVEAVHMAPAVRKRPASAAPMAAAAARRRLSGKQPGAAVAPPPPLPPQPQKRPASQPGARAPKHPRIENDAEVDKAVAAGPVVKRPAGHRGSSHFCIGWKQPQEGPDEVIQQDCVFSTSTPGAKVFRGRGGKKQCFCCDVDALPEKVKTVKGREYAMRYLRALHQFEDKTPYELFKTRVEKAGFEISEERVRQPKRGRKPAEKKVADWAEAKAKRQSTLEPPDRKQKRKFRQEVLEDQRHAKNLVFPGSERRARASGVELDAPVGNGTGLPPAEYSDYSKALEAWCLRGSWGMCPNCQVLQPREFYEADLRRERKPELAQSQCKRCSAKRKHYAPKPEDVPKPLQDLTPEIISALSLLDVDVGDEVRSRDANGKPNGYRKKVKMIRFSWSEKSPKKKLRKLPHADKEKAKAAYKHLLECEESSYRDFHKEREDFFNGKRDKPDERQRLRPLHFIEKDGLECAIWPHLYWATKMCESHERYTDQRRAERRARKNRRGAAADSDDDSDSSGHGADHQEDVQSDGSGRAQSCFQRSDESDSDKDHDSDNDGSDSGSDRPAGEGDEESDDDDAEDESTGNHSIRRSFMAKVLSPLIGYGDSFELLQFVYDLSLWSTLGGRKNLGLGDAVPMRVLMKGNSFSPIYWREVHNGLIDLVRQVGMPKMFWTISPYEYLAPYHEWMQDEMAKSLRSRMHLPAAESLHMAHALLEITHGLLTGVNRVGTSKKGGGGRGWKKHILSNKDDASKPIKLIVFTRLEFQDGSRKEGTFRYQGSGRPHAHVLIFADELEPAKVEQFVQASLPLEENLALRGKVLCSQKDRSDESKWPIYDGPEGWSDETSTLKLKHSEDDEDAGVHRAYFTDIMDGFPCHQDLQVSDGESLLLQYVTKYAAKFSDAAFDDWFNDEGSATSVARRMVNEYHPYEPEVWLQLNGANFRQWRVSTASKGKRDVRAPWPGMETAPAFVDQYAKASRTWRRADMPLLEYLRKTSDEGQIAHWIAKPWREQVLRDAHAAYAAEGGQLPLQKFRVGATVKNFNHYRAHRARHAAHQAHVHAGGSLSLDKFLDEVSEGKHQELLANATHDVDFRDFARDHAEKKLRETAAADAEIPVLPTPPLGNFAGDFPMHGGKIVAVDYVYRLNDRFFGQWLALHVPFVESMDELLDAGVDRLVPKKYRWFATALRRCDDHDRVPIELRDFWRRPDRIRTEMKEEAHTHDHIEDVQAMVQGQITIVQEYLSGVRDRAAEEHELLSAADGGDPQQARAAAPVEFNAQQKKVEKFVNRAVDRAVVANHSENAREADAAGDEAWQENKPIIVLGKPGTGKTTVVKECIRRASSKGANILFALPTAQLASRMREALRGVDNVCVDTCHAAFRFGQPTSETLALMTSYDMVVVDEISLLDLPHFQSLMKMWHLGAKRIPALVILGDKQQLPAIDAVKNGRPWESTAWASCTIVTLHQAWRCKDPAFLKILDTLRVDKPSAKMLRSMCRGHKAWSSDDPDKDDVVRHLNEHEKTVIVTCTRQKAEAINKLAVEGLFAGRRPIATLEGEIDINPANYDEGSFREDRKPVPAQVPIYIGARLYLTQNVRKDDDYVNGMACTVLGYTPNGHGGVLKVRTKTGHLLPITMWTNTKVKGHSVRHFPIRLGYASTIHKVQGDEFAHITVVLDKKFCPAAGYTALSRVQRGSDYSLAGKLTPEHFIPATWLDPA